MPSLSQRILFLVHVLALAMAIIEFLLNCFRRRKPVSEQSRPLCTQEEGAQPDTPVDQQPITLVKNDTTVDRQSTPDVKTFAPLPAQHQDSPQQLSLPVGQGSSFEFSDALPGGFAQAPSTAAIAHTPPTPALLPDQSGASSEALPEDKASPLELRTRELIARTPFTGPSPATSEAAAGSSFTHTPQSNAQTPSEGSFSTPSAFGLPEFMLEGDYLGMQTPQIVGMNNPVTAFKEHKQLKRHETPFDTRVEHLMEKERLFREMYVQHKSSQGSDGNVRQRRPASGDKATAGNASATAKLGIENVPSPAVTL